MVGDIWRLIAPSWVLISSRNLGMFSKMFALISISL